MRQRYILLLSAAAASLLQVASCGKQEIPAAEYGNSEGETIGYMPVLSGGTKGSMVAGTTYDYSKLGPFYAKVWNKEAEEEASVQFGYTKVDRFTHPGGSKHTYWSTVDGSGNLVEYFWKKKGNNPEYKYFYAYVNLPATGATVTSTVWSSQELQYNVPATAAAQKDILLGLGNGTGETKNGYVGRFATIIFGHPLTAVKFRKGTIEGWAKGDKIENIRIIGASYKGTYSNSSVSGSSWSGCSGSTTVSMTDTSDTFFLIPQTLSSDKVTVKADFTLGGTTYSDVTGTIATGGWEAGKYYTYTLSFNQGTALMLTVNLANWGKIQEDIEVEAGSVLGYDDPAVKPWTNQDEEHIPYSD